MESSLPRSVTLFFRLFEFSRNFFEFSDDPDRSEPIRSRQKSSSAAEIQRLQVKREGEREREAQSGF